MPIWLRRTVFAVGLGVVIGVVAALAGVGPSAGIAGIGADEQPSPQPPAPQVSAPEQDTVVVTDDADPARRALTTSALLYDAAPVVVLAGAGDAAAQAVAASAAVQLGAPLLLAPAAADGASPAATPSAPPPVTASPAASATPAALADEVDRLGARAVLAIGTEAAAAAAAVDADVVTAPATPAGVAAAAGIAPSPSTTVAADQALRAVAALERDAPAALVVSQAPADPDTPTPPSTPAPMASPEGGRLPETRPAPPLDDLVVLAAQEDRDLAAVATARAAGATVVVVRGRDPRADRDAIAALARAGRSPVIALGPDFGPVPRLRRRVDVAATGVELPGGGQVLYPRRRLVALYGHPRMAALGALGEQPLEAALTRAGEVAGAYTPLSDVPVVPAFEIIATVAAAEAGDDGDYSDETSVDELRPWVEAAADAGVYVVLDLQPGRTDFLTQAQRYAELLALPHVGLALDPEWRLQPDQEHLRQIGAVDIDEVNAVAAWLAELTRSRDLPQKLLILHQFRLSMIQGRERLDTGHDELAILIHADGNGSLPAKLETWRNLHTDPPEGVWWGWKNFYDEDAPTPTPEETMAVEPAPLFISYQ